MWWRPPTKPSESDDEEGRPDSAREPELAGEDRRVVNIGDALSTRATVRQAPEGGGTEAAIAEKAAANPGEPFDLSQPPRPDVLREGGSHEGWSPADIDQTMQHDRLQTEAWAESRVRYFAAGQYAPRIPGRPHRATAFHHDMAIPHGGPNHGMGDPVQIPDGKRSHTVGHMARTASRANHPDRFGELRPSLVLTALRKASSSVQTPIVPLPHLSVEMGWSTITLDGFEINAAGLLPTYRRTLDELAVQLTDLLEHFPDTFVSIVGHTEATAHETADQELGRRRAEEVRAYLLARGVPLHMMRAYSVGASALTIGTTQCEPRNRCVEIQIMKCNFFRLPQPVSAKAKIGMEAIASMTSSRIAHLPPHVPPTSSTDGTPRRTMPLVDFLGEAAVAMAKIAGLPLWAQERLRELGGRLPLVGLKAVCGDLAQDRHIGDEDRARMKQILESLPELNIQ
jgi:OmpA family protein